MDECMQEEAKLVRKKKTGLMLSKPPRRTYDNFYVAVRWREPNFDDRSRSRPPIDDPITPRPQSPLHRRHVSTPTNVLVHPLLPHCMMSSMISVLLITAPPSSRDCSALPTGAESCSAEKAAPAHP